MSSAHKQKRFEDYLRTVIRYKLSIVSITAIGVGVASLIVSSVTPIYKAQTSLLLEPVNLQAFNQNMVRTPINMSSIYLTQLELIRSRTLAEKVIQDMNLHKRKEFHSFDDNLIKKLVRAMIGAESAEAILQQKQETIKNLNVKAAVPILQRNMAVKNGSNKDILVISYKSTSSELSAAVANKIAGNYIEAIELSEKKNNHETIVWLNKNMEQARSKLVESEAALQSFQKKLNVTDLKDQRSLDRDKFKDISSLLVKAKTDVASARIRLEHVKNVQANGGDILEIRDVQFSPAISSLKERESAAMANFSQLSSRYGEKHPKLINARSELDNIRTLLVAESRKVISQLQKEYELTLKNEQSIKKIYDQQQNSVVSEKDQQFQLSKLEMDVETNRQIYDLLLTRLKEADINRNSTKIKAKIIDSARAPQAPSEPNVAKFISKWGFVAFVLAVILAFIRDSFDTTLKTAQDIEERLGLNVLGIFPKLRVRDTIGIIPERITADMPRSTYAESINNIRTNVIFSAHNEPPQVIAVTSAVAGEGKTTVSSNLSISMARLGPTILIEVDTRRPRIARMLSSRVNGGVFEFVTGKKSLRECVVADKKVKNLYVMPIVNKPAKPIEFLSSKRFEEAINTLRKKFKYIILDTPPVIPVSDTLVMTRLVDGIIMIVGAETTRLAASREAVNRFVQVRAELLGAILSKGNLRTLKTYGEGYYYGYDSYYSGKKGNAY